MAVFNQNFRVTTDYQLEIADSSSTTNYYLIWVKGTAMDLTRLMIATTPDTTSVALVYPFSSRQLPTPPATAANANYRLKEESILQILNVDTNLWHTLYINNNESNPTLSVAQEGEE